MERTRPGSRTQFRNCEPRPLGCWALQSHCSQVKKRTLRKEKGIFSLELKLALTINLLAVAGVTPQLLPCGAGARPQEVPPPRRPGQLLPLPWLSIPGTLLQSFSCLQAGGRGVTHTWLLQRSQPCQQELKIPASWHRFRAAASPLALSSTNTLPESWISTGSIHKLFLEDQRILTWDQIFPPSSTFLLAFVSVRTILSKFIFLKNGFQVLR